MDNSTLDPIPEAERWWERTPLEDLIRMLDDEDEDRRRIAVHELGRRGIGGDTRVIAHLIRILDRDYHSMSERAVDDLARIGAPAVPALIAALMDRTERVRVRGMAARALGSGGDPRAVEPMLAILQDASAEADVRAMIAFYAGRLGDRRAVTPLLTVAASAQEDVRIRRNALWALSELRDPQSFHALLALLPDEQVGNMAGTALQELADPRAIDLVLPTFATDDERWRVNAAAIVGKVGEPAVQPLLDVLASADWRVRSAGANALGFARDERAMGPLIHLLGSDPHPDVRSHAAGSLSHIDPTRAVDPLVRALSDEDVHVRLSAMHGLYHLAQIGKAPTSILPIIEQVVEHDMGTIQGQEIIRDVGARVVRQLRWNREEQQRRGTSQ